MCGNCVFLQKILSYEQKIDYSIGFIPLFCR